MLRSIPHCLLWRLERGIVLLRSGELLSWVIAIVLFAYLLPAVLIGAILYGVAIVICFLMDAARLVKPPDPQGPGWVALWMIMWVVPKTDRDEFVGDLVEEYEIILKERGRTEAMRWFRGQVLRSIPHCLLWRLERAIRFLGSEEFLPRVIQITLCAYLLPAVLVVVLLAMIGIVICFLVDAARRFPPSMGRKLLQGVRSVIHKVVDILKKFIRRGGDWYRTWRPKFRPECAGMWPRSAKLFTWIIHG